MANIRQGVPAGWIWRATPDGKGRPRWIPAPLLRKAGWKGFDLKDGRGAWLARGPSIAAADELGAAVAAWRKGEPVPQGFRDCAPPGACEGRGPEGGLDPFSIGALLDAYLASNELKFKKNGQPRPAKTLADYRNKLKRLVDTIAGYPSLEAAKASPAAQAAYQAAVARLRSRPIFFLEPAEGEDGMVDLLYEAYWALRRIAGVHMAFGVLACASAWLTWCRRRRSRTIVNWARDVERETPPGRIRVWTWPEVSAVVAAAEKLGRPEVADAVVLALDLSWSQVDVLNLTWDRVATDENGRLRALTGAGGRQKTGRVGGTPFLQLGRRRLEAIRARQAAMDAKPIKVVHLARSRNHRGRKPQADSDYFRDLFAQVRTAAAVKVPSCAGVTFADLRDTAFTLGRRAGLGDDATASRTLQSRANVKAHGDRSYGEIGPEISDPAADQLDAWLEAELKKHKVAL